MRLLVLTGMLLLSATAAAEQVYKWKDENGVTHYGDKPLSADAKPIALPPLMPFGSSSTKKSSSRSTFSSTFKGGPAPYGGTGPRVEITEPAPDATLKVDGQFLVRVAISPVLGDSQKLNYYLDGELQNPAPTTSRALQYTGAEKGDHMVSVAITDSEGREVSRSEPVIVHLQPTKTATAKP